MPGPEKIVIGNVSFFKSDVKDYSVKQSEGENLYSVFLKDGTKLTFNNQNKDANASVFIGYDQAHLSEPSKKGVKFENISGGTITGTQNKDYYYLDNSTMGVLIAGGDADEVKIVSKDKPIAIVNKDAEDNVHTLNLSKERFINTNEGFFVPDATLKQED